MATVNDTWWLSCNVNTAVHVLDLFDWKFQDTFDPDTKDPKLPSTIVNLVGGDEKGGATLNKPKKGGWTDKKLAEIFAITNELPTPTPTAQPTQSSTSNNRTDPADTAPPGADMGSSSGGSSGQTESPVGAIAGGAVGGLVFGMLLVGGIFWWKRRKYAKKLQAAVELHGYSSGQHPQYPEMMGTLAGGEAYPLPQELNAGYVPSEMSAGHVQGGGSYYAPGKLDSDGSGHEMHRPPSTTTADVAPKTESYASVVSPMSPPLPAPPHPHVSSDSQAVSPYPVEHVPRSDPPSPGPDATVRTALIPRKGLPS